MKKLLFCVVFFKSPVGRECSPETGVVLVLNSENDLFLERWRSNTAIQDWFCAHEDRRISVMYVWRAHL